MIIVMEQNATEAQIDNVMQHLAELGMRPVINKGDMTTVVAAIGDESKLSVDLLSVLDGVKTVMPVMDPFKLASRASGHREDTVITFPNGVQIGGNAPFVVMAGPCSIEDNPEILLQVAEGVKASGAQFLRGGAFKPRTSPYDFQGLEEKGLQHLAYAREKTGLLIVTEVVDSQEVPLVAEYSDMLQIGARNMQNFKLLNEAGKQSKPVLLKRGLSATIKEYLLAAEYILHQGNPNVVLCERGIRGFDAQYTRNIMDLAAVPVLQKLSHLPVIVDPSHGTGQRYLIKPLSKAAVAIGASGLMIEVHHNPDKALSDGRQSLTVPQFQDLMTELKPLIDFCRPALTPA
jgi:3-deoxy-7-phosphoheptulonate synthase